ncbi:putative Altered inheritance of mitochondria protein 31, mitochondrial [Sclerotinia borealis F-4128]|uniref:Putative Altered inheritance of mitochondria protein 31, mitochondrial n=1 Tax=Sclerotinia borealis (strain F-4128) TaxID=1432307 RepID=W9CN56_SCLBF|nr:putative Altered inheritance of mitochondria protein 31, mitochondrial [Sclerotinia borealis F-4128]
MSNNTPLPSSFDGDTDFYEENRWQKLTRRFKEEPLIPLGKSSRLCCILTTMALFGASRAIRSGDHNRTQRMFRARIYAQGFTLLSMVAGSMYWNTDRKKRKEFEGVLEEQKAKEKNEAWIKELEARDEEDKEIRRARDERRRRSEGKPAAAISVANTTDSPVEGEQSKKGVMDQVQGMVWGKK